MVNLEVFLKACEAEYGKDLGWLFQQWVRRAGLPDLELQYSIEHPQEAQSIIRVSLDQKGDLYDLPVTLHFRAKAKAWGWESPVRRKESVWIRDKHTEWTFHLDEDIHKVSMNDGGWILTRDRVKMLPLSYAPQQEPIIARILPIVMLVLGGILGYYVGRKRAQRKAITPKQATNSS